MVRGGVLVLEECRQVAMEWLHGWKMGLWSRNGHRRNLEERERRGARKMEEEEERQVYRGGDVAVESESDRAFIGK